MPLLAFSASFEYICYRSTAIINILIAGSEGLEAGLGRVLDKSTRVQVQVLEKMTSTSTSTSTGFLKVLEYKYKYFTKYLSTSTEYFGCKL